MNLPNKLTISRIIIAPIITLLIMSDIVYIEYRYYVSLAVFLIAFFTDVLDGVIARKTDSITVFGIFADPIADKILVSSALISFVYLHLISPYIVFLLIGRDIIITGFRLIAMEKNVIISASILGKLKTVFEVIMISYIFLDIYNSWTIWAKYVIIGIVVFFALFSMIINIVKYSFVLREE